MKTLPFWQDDVVDQIMKGVIRPVELVENFVELNQAELYQRDVNFNSGTRYGRFLTIYSPDQIPEDVMYNLIHTSEIVMSIERDLNVKFSIRSLVRTISHHLKVYAAKGITDVNKIPMKSTHLYGKGVDVSPTEKPIKWLHEMCTEEFLEKHNIWMEHEQHTPSWVHWQTIPYPSWKPGKSRKYKI